MAGRTSEDMRKFATAHAIENSTGDYRELLSNSQIDAIHICSPPTRCIPRWRKRSRGGKACTLREMASTSEESISIAALTKKTDLANCAFYNVRFYPQVQNMRRMREAGDLATYIGPGHLFRRLAALRHGLELAYRIRTISHIRRYYWHTLVRPSRARHWASDHFALFLPRNFPQSAQTLKRFF